MTEDELKAIEERASEDSCCLADMQMQDDRACQAQLTVMDADVRALVAEVRRLRGLLKPFADIDAELRRNLGIAYPDYVDSEIIELGEVAIGPFRAAHEALK